MGPRFANAMYDSDRGDDDVNSKGIFGCLSCGGTVIQSVPCIYSAINNNDPGSILNCVSKNDVGIPTHSGYDLS